MKNFLSLLVLITSMSQPKAQDSLAHQLDWGSFDLKDLYIGINSSPKVDEGDAAFTSLEFGYAKSSLSQYQHAASSTYYFGQELGLSRNKLIHGTKVGAWVSAYMVTLGMEVVHQTDYQNHAFTLWPSFGLGLYPLKITMAGRVRLSGKGFQPQNKISFNLSYMLFNVSRKKRVAKNTN